jgi:hypothetical protein
MRRKTTESASPAHRTCPVWSDCRTAVSAFNEIVATIFTQTQMSDNTWPVAGKQNEFSNFCSFIFSLILSPYPKSMWPAKLDEMAHCQTLFFENSFRAAAER